MIPVDYIVMGSRTAAGVITKTTLTAAYTGNTKTLLVHGLQQIHLDFLYTPEATQTARYLEVKIENLDEFDNVVGSKSVFVPSSASMAVHSNRDGVLPIRVPGELTETANKTIAADLDLNIDAYKIKISARENGSATYGSAFINVRLSELQ